MDHEKIKELIILSFYNELSADEMGLLKDHLIHCKECGVEFGQINKLQGLISGIKLPEPDDKLLSEARIELRSAIRNEHTKKSFFENIFKNLNNLLFSNYKFAFGVILLIVIGIGIGYFLFNNKDMIDTAQFINASQSDSFEKNDIKIKNLRFIDSDASDGEVSFTFEAVKPVMMKGKIGDQMIQKVLAHSLLNEQNDGVRLRTLSAIYTQTENKKYPDKKVKSALISALKNDANPGVRREAILVLQNITIDEEIAEAFLYVLKYDKNSGLRVAAINALGESKINEKKISPEILEYLKQKSRDDENQYVRVRAKSILQEVYQQ